MIFLVDRYGTKRLLLNWNEAIMEFLPARLAIFAKLDSARDSRLVGRDWSTVSFDIFSTEAKRVFKLLVRSRIRFALSHFIRSGRRRYNVGPWRSFGLPLLCIGLSALFSGCTVSLPREQTPVGLPENIYISPPARDFSEARVLILAFESPDIQQEALYFQAPDPGYGAARTLYHALLGQGHFVQLSMQFPKMKAERAHQLNLARENGFDLIITGRVLYLFEGTSQLPSRVDVEVTMTEVATGQILLYAQAREVEPPIIESDLILWRIQGQNAAPTMALMERNALKFHQLLSACRSKSLGSMDKDSREKPIL